MRRWKEEFTSLDAFQWWKRLREPERESAWTTLAVVYQVLHKIPGLAELESYKQWSKVRFLGDHLSRKSLKLTPEQIMIAIESSAEDRGVLTTNFDYHLLSPLLKRLDVCLECAGLTKKDLALLSGVRDQLIGDGFGGDSRAAVATLNTILGEREKDLLWDGEAWAVEINRSVGSMSPDVRARYLGLLTHAGSVGFTKPSRAWFAVARKAAVLVDQADCASRIAQWLGAFTESGRVEWGQLVREDNADVRYSRGYYDLHGRFGSNLAYIKGLVYLAQLFPTANVLARLSDLIEKVSQWEHHLREESFTAAAAAVRVFDMIDMDDAIAALSRAELRVRWPKLRKLVTKTLDGAIARRGGSRDDLEETVVPDFGMKDGAVGIEVGDASATLAVGRGDRPTTTWNAPGKDPTHIVPKSLRQQEPAAVARVKAIATEIEKMHKAQRTRMDLLFRNPRSWGLDEWKQRYLNHGLLSGISRRLIWLIGDVPACFGGGGEMLDVDGREVKAPGDARIAIWHPALRSSQEVVAWRSRLESLGIAQPLKQAHREVYLLTDAERRTHTYSNRFAAHILRNHTALAISQVRKWKMGLYGGSSSPSLALPGFDLRAEWWLNIAGEQTDRMGFPLYLATDQVRFYRTGSDAPLPLEEIPPLAFTEVLRDIDLFISIASVGNDPNWSDAGPEGRYRDYWHSYSFGDLGESAKTRREVLQRLIPRLKIAERCSFTEKFLVVRGQKRTYKIHLGSGNILMEPNDQYLCIVPDSRARAGEDNLFLPFEGDNTLSIILSKALLLAEDTKIEDPTITRQIEK